MLEYKREVNSGILVIDVGEEIDVKNVGQHEGGVG